MLSIEKFNTDKSTLIILNPFATAVFAWIAYLIVTDGQSWGFQNHMLDWGIDLLFALLLALIFLRVFLGIVALKSSSIQIAYAALCSYLTLALMGASSHSDAIWVFFVVGWFLYYGILHVLLKRPSVLAAIQCLIGTLSGLFLTSEYIYFCRSIF
jgi:hypothetical protein